MFCKFGDESALRISDFFLEHFVSLMNYIEPSKKYATWHTVANQEMLNQ